MNNHCKLIGNMLETQALDYDNKKDLLLPFYNITQATMNLIVLFLNGFTAANVYTRDYQDLENDCKP